ncbi:DUF2510 domain-containing protein [Streptomyces sp. NBC_00237]|uniref:DUF2510 domain-containing protein n=1 Tax=Streptomyces sp. NBC_00237 TaxID=2975687 RepID=UPI002257145B|nr:DUF2510 domain-containing protein [Streptomyces sp. NBC_00237]MCX5202334.1 DUF2510 domain-containing protein [Streptomyces sp. NBC_00237]
MSMTTPPGWYQDPSAPTQERWWDGQAWSAHTRPPGQPQQPPAQPPQTPQYGYPQQPQGYGFPPAQPQFNAPPPPAAPPAPGGSGGGLSKGGLIAVITAGVVLVAAIVTGVVVLGGEDDEPKSPPVARTTQPVLPGGGDVATPPPATTAPSGDAGVLSDKLNGITLPLLSGWEIPEFGGDREAASMQMKESYDCPSGGGFCYHGTVSSRTAPADQTTPEAVAKADIPKATELAYGKDFLDREKHDGVKSHQVVKAEAVTVAGKQGYLVRWKVVTGKGPGGYVQSLAFPSSMGPSSIVLVRFAFDAGPEGPPVDGMDTITQGIRTTN